MQLESEHERAKRHAIAKLRELAPELTSPTFADALRMLCHCGEQLEKDCTCNEERRR
jgi:hypothetical protein